MFKVGVFILFLIVAAAANNSFEDYYRSQVNPFTTSESLDHSIRIQSAVRVSEVALSDKDGCLRRSMCVLGAIASTRENGNLPKVSIANGAQNFLHIVERMIAVAGMTGLTKEQLPNLRQVIASNVVGKSSGDLRMCESLFPCQTSVEEIRNEALLATSSPNQQNEFPTSGLFATLFAPTMTSDSFNPSSEIRQSRSTCKISGALCPGITIGCALCGVFAPATCGDTCIIAGLYCGTSGYACQYEASLSDSDEDSAAEDEATEVGENGEDPPETADAGEAVEESEGKRRKGSRPRFYPFQF